MRIVWPYMMSYRFARHSMALSYELSRKTSRHVLSPLVALNVTVSEVWAFPAWGVGGLSSLVTRAVGIFWGWCKRWLCVYGHRREAARANAMHYGTYFARKLDRRVRHAVRLMLTVGLFGFVVGAVGVCCGGRL